VTASEIPRLYTSFVEFERDERRRLGLPELPAVTDLPVPAKLPAVIAPVRDAAAVTVPRPFVRVALPKPTARISIDHLTPASMTDLRSEGIEEIGCAPGTSVLFVRTRKGLHVLHATWVPERQLDDYAVRLAVTWIEGHGMPSCAVAKNLGISEPALRKALLAAGYDRLSPELLAQRAGARAARKIGNRKGRLVRTHSAEASAL